MRIFLRHHAASFVVLVGFWLLSFAPSAGAQVLMLNVPFRPGSLQTYSSTIEFDADTIAGSATVSVGTGVLNVPASACGGACTVSTTNGAGDDLSLTRISGSTRVRLVITYLSVTPGDACSAAVPPGGLSMTITLTGFTFVPSSAKGYRITSFRAPSAESCDIAYARVGTPRPTLSGGGLTKLGRLPLNVVLAIDKSPSMEWTVPNSMDIRWDRLKASVNLFTSVWDVIGAPPMGTEGHADDRLGLVFFGGTASNFPLGGGANFFVQRNAQAAPWGTPVSNALNGTTLQSGTGIGAGLTNARALLNTVKILDGDTATILFSDGEQNATPCVIRSGETLSPTSKPYPGRPGVFYTDQCTVAAAASPSLPLTLGGLALAKDVLPRGPIFTVGLGEGGMAAAAQLLDEIASETAGRVRFPNDGIAMDTSFVDTLVDNLKGGTVNLMDRSTATLATGVPAGSTHNVVIDASVTRATFVLGWDGANNREVRLEVRRPDGSLATPTQNRGNPNSRVVSFDLPPGNPAGTWQARVLRSSGTSSPLRYHLSAYAVESQLNMQVVESRRLGTGRPISVEAEIAWGDTGLGGLPPNAVRATVEQPGQNLGNLLHDSSIGLEGPLDADRSPLMVKLHQLAGNANLLQKIEPVAQSPIALVDQGNGRYVASFSDTRVAGKYRIRLDFDWDDPRTGRIKRVQFIERQVPVQASDRGSIVNVSRNLDAGVAVIGITPRDNFGNYAGPGYEGRFNVVVNGGTPELPVVDQNLTGDYQLRLTGLAAGADPNVKITFGGQTIRDGKLSGIGGSGGTQTSGRYALWLALGSTYPHGSFGNQSKSGFAGTLGFEYAFTPSYAIEATLGRHSFGGQNGGSDIDVTQFGVNGKFYIPLQSVKPFITAGVGGYAFDPGSTRFGANLGAGLQLELAPQWSLEGRYAYHWVNGNSPNSKYSTLQLGLRYAF